MLNFKDLYHHDFFDKKKKKLYKTKVLWIHEKVYEE